MAELHGVISTSTAPVQHMGCSPTTTTTRPKIKIIHIIAPDIIKTDVANFRDLVQRLTGKPAAAASSVATSPTVEEDKETVVKKRPPPPPEATQPVVMEPAERSGFTAEQEPCKKKRKITCDVKVEEGGFGEYGLDCNDPWMDLNPGGFLSFLEEELNSFPGLTAADHDLLPLPLGGSPRMDLVGEMYAS
jgi:hypothetical protein